MKKILILLGVVLLVFIGFLINRARPWSPSHTADYFLSSAYWGNFKQFSTGKIGGGSEIRVGQGDFIDNEYLLSGDSQVINAAIEKTREEVIACLQQDHAEILSSIGGNVGASVFSFAYISSGRHGYCSIRAIPSSSKLFAPASATQLIIIFHEM